MSTYTKIKTLPLSLFNNAEYLSFMNHVLDLANGNSGGGDSESPDEISLLTGSDGIPELGLTKEFLETYEADLLAMADVVDESRISQETEQMTLHDTNRDNLAIYIITRISRAGTLPLEAERDAGKYLYKIIKPYNGIARLTISGQIKKIDDYQKQVILMDKTRIDIDCILDIDGQIYELANESETNFD